MEYIMKFTILLICLFPMFVMAQTSGSITFEKTVNMYKIIERNLDGNTFLQWDYDAYKKDHPRQRTQQSVLTFSDQQTLYTPLPDSIPLERYFSRYILADQPNTVFANLTTGAYVCQKKVYNEYFFIQDTLKRIQWKLTSEMRDIAGYHCRRANAIIMDSVYVVAFYTDQIHVPGGPESFTGLPGMILGVALPHDNVTWFATSVSFQKTTVAPPAQKGKVVTANELKSTLQTAMSAKDKFWWWALM
jgi:GLPGLI family protein